jgi:hypothetical protein
MGAYFAVMYPHSQQYVHIPLVSIIFVFADAYIMKSVVDNKSFIETLTKAKSRHNSGQWYLSSIIST